MRLLAGRTEAWLTCEAPARSRAAARATRMSLRTEARVRSSLPAFALAMSPQVETQRRYACTRQAGGEACEEAAFFAGDSAAVDEDDGSASGLVTFWEELPPHTAGKPMDVGHLLHRLHAMTAAGIDLPATDPFVQLEARIDSLAF
jgi:hypothetical protein